MKMPKRNNRNRIVKTVLFCTWVLLFGLLLQRDYFIESLDTREAVALERAERTEFQGIYFKNKKIGYVQNQYIPSGDALEISQKAYMRLNISDQVHPINLDLQARLSAKNTLETFHFNFSSPFYSMTATGTVSGNSVSFTLDTGKSTIEDRVVLESPPFLSTSRRAYLLTKDIQPGDKVRIPWFDPVSLTAKDSILEYRGKEQVLIHGRVFSLHRFIEFFSGARINSWLDDEGNVIKEESPAGFVFLKEPEFKAKTLDEVSSELLSSVSVEVSGTMVDLTDKTSAYYRLSLPEDHQFNLNSGRQTFADGVLTIHKEQLSAIEENNVSECSKNNQALEATPYIQAEADAIVSQSKTITSGLNSDLEKVTALAEWVYNSLEKRPVLGIPDALTTLNSRVGDCNEHASLFAALSRAAGIPTKIAAGVVYHKKAFYYHAWNEVCLSGQWISLDTTTDQLPADLTHIKFVEGGLQEQIQIGALLGTLQIEPVPEQ